ncbi:MAG: hypothetical protein Q9166_002247 [cf. Caloplaca sp. 2 TL-2023]
MSRYSGLLERHRLQTYTLPPDKCMHILSTGQEPNGSTQVLYKKSGDSSGYLGGGSFGSVHLETIDSVCKDAPAIRAVKTISKRAAETSKVHWEQEVENLLVLSQHPEVFVKIFGWWEDDKSIFLPMEYFQESDLSKNKDFIRDEDDIQVISRQLAIGLNQMHSLKIIHRDIKPQNVFVVRQRPTWQVKIGDFGFSKRVSDSVSSPFSARGTTKYMAPEYRDLMNNCETSDFGPAVDMWSFGCLIYELFAKKCPFDEDESQALLKYVRDGTFPRQPLDDCGASSESIWLIMKLLEREAHLRLSAQDALDSVWLHTTVPSATCESPLQDPTTQQEDRTVSLRGSTIVPSPAGTIDSMSASLGVAIHQTMSAPELIVVSDEPQMDDRDGASASVGTHLGPSLAERAITLPGNTLVQISADDATLLTSHTAQVPELPARPKSSNAMRPNNLHQGVRELQLADAPNQPGHTPVLDVQSKGSTLSARSVTIARKPLPKAIPPQTFPCLKTTKLNGNYIDMAFKNIKFKPQRKPTCDICESRRVFNPVIKPSAVYYCKDCGHRPLCARCIVESIRSSGDPHEADHKLQPWIQAHTFPLQEFLDRFQPLQVDLAEGVDAVYGKSWLSSDHSFTPPAEGSHGTRWVLNAKAGEFDMAIQVRVLPRPEALESAAIGIHKSMMVNAKAVPLGSILCGAHVVSSLPVHNEIDNSKSRHLPDRPIEQSFKLTKEEQTITMKLGFKLNATEKQKIEVHVRGSYDVLYFKAGSPFRWWLDYIM